MKGITHLITTGLFLSALLLVTGCSKPSAIKTTYIPNDIPPISSDKARIVLTRPAKFAIHPLFIIVDTGTNIEANAFMMPEPPSLKNTTPDSKNSSQPSQNRDSARSLRSFADFFWYNPMKPERLFIGDHHNHNKKWRSLILDGFISGSLNVSWENGSYKGIGRRGKQEATITSFDDPTYQQVTTQLRGSNLITFMEAIMAGSAEPVPSDTSLLTRIYNPNKGFALKDTDAVVSLISRANDNISSSTFTHVQAIWEMDFGETLIWEREPGDMHLAAILERDGIFLQMPQPIKVEAGRTYYVDFHIETLGDVLWHLRKIDE